MIANIIVLASVIIYILKLKKDIKIGKMYNEQAEGLLNEYTRAFRYISRTHKGLVNEAFYSVNEEDKRA